MTREMPESGTQATDPTNIRDTSFLADDVDRQLYDWFFDDWFFDVVF